ncbi:MAG: RNA polymerase sigma factor [Longimicrobiales bacterium]
MESDAGLVARARAGDEGAFEDLVRRHLAAAHAVAVGVLLDSADADDVCQDSFIAALQQLDSLAEPHRFGAWLLRIVRNRALSALRKQRVRAAEPLEWAVGAAGDEDPGRDAERSALRDRLTAALEILPEHQRQIVLLHDLEEWKHREIGELLGMPEGTVRHHLFQARRALRARLGPQQEKEG